MEIISLNDKKKFSKLKKHRISMTDVNLGLEKLEIGKKLKFTKVKGYKEKKKLIVNDLRQKLKDSMINDFNIRENNECAFGGNIEIRFQRQEDRDYFVVTYENRIYLESRNTIHKQSRFDSLFEEKQ